MPQLLLMGKEKAQDSRRKDGGGDTVTHAVAPAQVGRLVRGRAGPGGHRLSRCCYVERLCQRHLFQF